MSSGKPNGTIRVGDWTVDPALDTISRPGQSVKLEPRNMRLLVFLANSSGTVVSIDRLLNEVWPGVIVGPASVYQAVSQLRQVLGDTDPEPTYIATVPRKGYRLIATVTNDLPAEPSQPIPAAESPPMSPAPVQVSFPPRSHSPRKALLWSATGAVMCAIVATIALKARNNPPPPENTAASIVVLPFVDLTADHTNQAFCDGLTEELSNWLTQIPTLRVVSRSSASAFHGNDTDARTIGRKLSTNHVLEGSMRRSGNHLRITVQLIDANNGYNLWSANYDRPMEDTIKMQEDVSRMVASNLELRMTRDTTDRFAARSTAHPDASRLYLLAQHYRLLRTREDNDRAIELYKQSLDADPGFVPAYVGLSLARLNQRYFNARPPEQVAAEVESLLASALRLDPKSSGAYGARGALRSDQANFPAALADLGRAIILNPNDSSAYAETGRLLLQDGRPRDALWNFTRAIELDPLDAQLPEQSCTALADMARYTEATRACERARALTPEGATSAEDSAWLESSRGNIDNALEQNAESIRGDPGNFDLYWIRANLFLNLGLAARAREAVDAGRTATHNDDDANAVLASVVYQQGGPEALRRHLIFSRLEASTHAVALLEAAYARLLLGEPAAVKALIARAHQAPDRVPGLAELPWYARFGTSAPLDLAVAELALGERKSAQDRLETVQAMLNRMIGAGVERNAVYDLRARTLALLGKPDEAMRDLTRAAALGWRRVWWAQHEPYLASLRTRSDFQALMTQVSRSNERLIKKLDQAGPVSRSTRLILSPATNRYPPKEIAVRRQPHWPSAAWVPYIPPSLRLPPNVDQSTRTTFVS